MRYRWVIFDVDGVLIDTGESYDIATKLTVEYFLGTMGRNVEIDIESIRVLRRRGSFGNDFLLCEALIRAGIGEDTDYLVKNFPLGGDIEWVRKRYNVKIEMDEIERAFNTFYLGNYYNNPIFEFNGLWKRDKPLVEKEALIEINKKVKVGVITGRNLLELNLAEGILGFKFKKSVTREMYLKPDPRALWHITRGEKGIYLGDTTVDELLVENYRKRYGKHMDFIMIGRAVSTVNEAIGEILEHL